MTKRGHTQPERTLEAHESIQFTANPQNIAGSGKASITVTAEPEMDFRNIFDVYGLGGAEVLSFEALPDRLELVVNPLHNVESTQMSLMLDFGDDEVHIARDLVSIEREDAEIEDGHSENEEEQTQGEEERTGENNETD